MYSVQISPIVSLLCPSDSSECKDRIIIRLYQYQSSNTKTTSTTPRSPSHSLSLGSCSPASSIMATTKAAAAATGAGSTSHHPKTGAISKGYNFASTWEQVSYSSYFFIHFCPSLIPIISFFCQAEKGKFWILLCLSQLYFYTTMADWRQMHASKGCSQHFFKKLKTAIFFFLISEFLALKSQCYHLNLAYLVLIIEIDNLFLVTVTPCASIHDPNRLFYLFFWICEHV